MEQKQDCDRMNLVGDELLEAGSQMASFKNFILRWKVKISEIKKICLNDEQSRQIAIRFLDEWSKFMREDGISNKAQLLGQLSTDLHLAIIQANTNYWAHFPGFWDRFHKLKLPDISLIKK